MPGSLQPLPSRKTTPENKEPTLSVRDVKLLGRLKTVSYQDRKDRNPHRVSGTCEWFVSHRLFNNWLTGSQGKDCQALWVSADPGCGKSVLAKYLVDHVLPSTQSRTTCYFFFKDDFEDQKSAANAMCCILHQLFTQKPILFSATVRTQLEAEGEKLTTSFRSLWELLLKVAGEKNAGEIICILDALDECAEDDRQILAWALLDQHRAKKAPNLKLLLTSRPFGSIRRDFQPSDTAELAVVHLSGENEEEIEQISKEIDIFIEARVRGVGAKLKLDEDEQDMLLRGLLSVPHRTYLWVYLTLDYIESNENINKRKIKEALSQLPESVDEAYEKILSTSRAPEEARKALHIIVAAERPLTLCEMCFALAIRPSHQSYQDIDLDSDERFRERLRNICGLFVVVIDSKIYLLHQTAKEFLVPADSQRASSKVAKQRKTTPRWKHCLEPAESQRTLGEICLWNLQLPELLQNAPELLQNAPKLLQNAPEFLNDTPEQFPLPDGWNHLLRDYKFLEYSTYFWAAHLRALHTGVDKKLTQAMLDICLACHQHRQLWFRAAAREDQRAIMYFKPNIADDLKTTPLMIASYFGLVPVVKALVKAGREQLLARDTRRRTALVWAAGCGHADVVRVLIDGQPRIPRGFGWLGIWKPAIDPAINRVILEAADCEGRTPLHWAARASSAGAVKLLLDNGADIEARGKYQNTPLLVAVEHMEPDVTRLLLERGAYVEARGDCKLTPLAMASGFDGVLSIMRLLLQFGADVDGRELHRDGEPLFTAISYGQKDNVNLLLENKADVGLRDRNGDTAFTLACRLGCLDIAKLLLKKGVDIEERDKAGQSALSRACLEGNEAVVIFLVEQGADIESRCNNNRTPLYHCLEGCYSLTQGSIAKFLLDNGADIEARDQGGTSILAALTTAYYNDPTPLEWLLENGADIESQNLYGETPLVHASMRADPSLEILLRAGANVNVTARDGQSVLQLVIAKCERDLGWSHALLQCPGPC
jgi:ankyrin repeat protein